MCVGFTIKVAGANVRCELADNPLLSQAQDGERAAVLMGRLYYRAEAARLRAEGMTDAEIALAAYRRAGQAGLEQLEGDFAVVLWDGPACRLIGLRDPNGSYPLFWVRRGDGFAIGTGMGRLLQVIGRSEIDPEYFAEFLTAPGFGHFEPDDRCAYLGVTRVPAGIVIVYDAVSRAITRRRYWDWAEVAEDPGLDRVEQVAPLVAERLRAAVRERLVGPAAAHLSGGMDSTSVALLADQMVGKGERNVPLHTISLVYGQLPVLAAERPYVEAGIGRLRAGTPHRLVADEYLDFDAYADAPPADEPFHGVWWVQNEQAIDNLVSSAGATTLRLFRF
jgi:asparagine synthase (glutamine-hydrolysing)